MDELEELRRAYHNLLDAEEKFLQVSGFIESSNLGCYLSPRGTTNTRSESLRMAQLGLVMKLSKS